MRFRLSTLFWIFALFASAMATLGPAGGILAAAFILGFWIYTPERWPAFLLLYIAMIGILIALFLPAVQNGRPSLQLSCMSNLRDIAQALHLYEKVHGSLPPAYIADENGKPMHSWRVLLLPYLEGNNLYSLYDFDEPWDGPNNRLLWKYMPDYYRCPGRKHAEEHGLIKCPPHSTNYFAVVGPQTDTSHGNRPIVLLLESSESVCWMEPKDIRFEDAVEQLTNGSRNGHLTVQDEFLSVSAICNGRNVVFAKGHTEFIDSRLSEDTAKGKELFEWKWKENDRTYSIGTIVKWRRVYSLSMFVGFSLLPLLKNFRKKKVEVA